MRSVEVIVGGGTKLFKKIEVAEEDAEIFKQLQEMTGYSDRMMAVLYRLALFTRKIRSPFKRRA